MIVRKYIVNDMKEAIVRAKYELGRDAIIINQNTVTIGKWYNPFKQKRLEVTMAVEEGLKVYSGIPDEKPQCSLEDAIKGDPIFKNAKEELKEQLKSYCKLYQLKYCDLSVKQKKEFINIAYRNNCFEKKLKPGRVNVLIGPTGVGKTTTIAKIAAEECMTNKKKVGLITIDTYRIGAVEQLKTYADILNIPFEVVNEPDEMKEKIDKLSACDILLIDTLGTSPNNKNKLADIRRYIDNIGVDSNIYLVLSISTDKETALSTIHKYKTLNYNALIMTKFDEVNSFTNVWNILENNDFPVEYFCCGQSVPEDIRYATLDNLIAYSEEIY